MIILAVESSCDETAAAVSRNGREILSDVVFSQADMHALYGGVVPEIASRRHIEKVSLVAEQALAQAGVSPRELDAVAATCAPGLIGALLVGANFAKGCAMALGVPFVPVHHIRGHIAAAYAAYPELEPPFTALVASGGHTTIIDVEEYTRMRTVGRTRDDAAGEAFDKIARVMGLPYPGGAALDRLAQQSAEQPYRLPRSHVADGEYDMSFSGLKTAAVNLIHNAEQKGERIDLPGMARSVAEAVADITVPRLISAALACGRDTVIAAGGVAANSVLRARLEAECRRHGLRLFLPPLKLCGDNGSMIAVQAYYELAAGNIGTLAQNCFATLAPDEQVGLI